MECNKDEAVRAKEIAEMKFYEREYADAKRFALKALKLFPALEGLSQFLTTLDVYIAAEDKISGEMDWYRILGVNPFADDQLVRYQYKKLALALHPDKNKSLGAEGAFKLVVEAWSLLSDKSKRLAYDQNRSLKGVQHNAPNHFGSQSEAPSSNDFCNLNKNTTSNVRTGNNDAQVPPTSVPPHENAGTFWTVCNQCRTQFEYLRIYLNNVLVCPNCNQVFVAIENSPPPDAVKSSNWSSWQHNQNSRQSAGKNNSANPGRTCAVSQNSASNASSGISSFDSTNLQWDLNSRMAGFDSTDGSSSFAAASFKQQVCEKVNSQMYMRSDGTFNNVDKPMKKMRKHGSASLGANMGKERTSGFSGFTTKYYNTRELSMHEVRNMLIDRAKIEINKKLQEWRSMAEAVRNKDKGNKRQKDTFDNETTGLEKHGGSSIDGKRHLDSHSVPVTSDDVNENQAGIAMNVPDPDFHNFDMHRAEDSFEENQVWAAYDVDGMPRYYARIHKVISIKPFRMWISWLNSRSNVELGPIDWIGSGFDKTCGNFRTGRHEMTESLNSFSHKVRWTKGNRGVVCIFPGKGEVWALYRNWSPDWNENTPDDVIHKYDMVVVLEDFNDEDGVLVSPLVKLDGFRTVFHKQDQVRKIPKVELFRFSHQVPNYLLTGQEASNAPKGCLELDPAAIPLDILQTLTEADEALNSAGNRKEDKLPTLPEKHVSGKEDDVSTTSIA
ncbi:hypothetical protein Lal_00017419 [Lupinus albus]|uniref:Putative DnaJ domain-containing protein n=1 Tax=Lupinus albus TaxID=3870 RepID=A0A6A4QPB1_LUPAL|nr:putative DnaJ domain-containing protein [Lupinus albus]KAF1869842.1 hypothetical protein Lal_00017419 [Lupinus albus]